MSETRLILKPKEPEALTGHRETDARTALCRGMAEYLLGLSIDLPGGRQLKFNTTFSSWAEPEDASSYPSAIVYARGTGTYDAASLTPHTRAAARLDGDRYLVKTGELVVPLTLEIWATDPEERMGLVAMCEDALNPVEWMSGARLEFPHYFNARGSFLPTSLAYDDDDVSATQRYRRAMIEMDSVVPVYRVSTFPEGKPRFVLQEVATDAVLEP